MEEIMNPLEMVVDVLKEQGVEEAREKSLRFDALCSIDDCLQYIATNKIKHDSDAGKHTTINLNKVIRAFNQEFMKMGVNPNLSINWQLSEAEEE